ncbi:MAG: flavodoxin family protein, partial [Chloroflexi bacterium]|nr:flavodoxin family protein [Chloroflexota bacterium]
MAKLTVKIPEKVKLLAVNFSPRKDGITSEMIKEALSWAETYEYVETEYIDAADYPSYPCEGTACLKCWGFKAPADATNPQCYQHPDDGVNVIMPKTLEADGLLIGFPVHARGVPSRLRIFQEKDLQINSPFAFSKWAGARRYRTVGVICQGMGTFGGQEIVYD